jgi:hypothetical protein
LNDGKEKLVVYFEDRRRGVVLNGTRYDTIVGIAKSHKTEDWVGTPLTVYAGTTNFGGKKVDCVAVASAKTKSAEQKRREVADVVDDAIPEQGDPLPKNMTDEDDDF